MAERSRPRRPNVDIAIITVREDEERSILKRLRARQTFSGKGQIYAVEDIAVSDAQRPHRTVAVVRCSAEGQAVAQNVARDVIDDLDPGTIFVVGIGGGFPAKEFCLGDVIVATRVQDLRIEALMEGKEPEIDVRGGPVEPEVERVVAALQRIQLRDWNSRGNIGPRQPSVQIIAENFYGPSAWRAKAKAALVARFGTDGKKERRPLFTTGALVSSDYLVKQVETAARWLSFVRKALACEMETAGVFSAARTAKHTYPVYGIRGLSDVIGFKRSDEWTTYACEAAAAFTFALIKTGFVPSKRSRATPQASKEVGYIAPLPKRSERGRRCGALTGLENHPESRTFRPSLSFMDRGDVEAAVSAILAGAALDRVEPTAQLSITAAWQKFGFIEEAKKCLKILAGARVWSRLDDYQKAYYRVIELKVLSHTSDFARVRDSYKMLVLLLARLNLHEHRAAVYRRAAIAYAALGDPKAARGCVVKAQAIAATMPGEHSRITDKVFSAITLALGTTYPVGDWALKTIIDAPERYLSSELDRSSFQADPLKSAVACLFFEAAFRISVYGEGPEGWICVTACYVLAIMGSAHPLSEGYAELLNLLCSRQQYRKLFHMAMSPESAARRAFPARYANVNRYLSECQDFPELLQGRSSADWAVMRARLDQLMAYEMNS